MKVDPWPNTGNRKLIEVSVTDFKPKLDIELIEILVPEDGWRFAVAPALEPGKKYVKAFLPFYIAKS